LECYTPNRIYQKEIKGSSYTKGFRYDSLKGISEREDRFNLLIDNQCANSCKDKNTALYWEFSEAEYYLDLFVQKRGNVLGEGITL
jgi:hypothetical protein